MKNDFLKNVVMKTMKKPIEFSLDGKKCTYVDKRKLKQDKDYGYHIVYNGFIHYFDKNKNYETSKWAV